jgi:hypothetical protein
MLRIRISSPGDKCCQFIYRLFNDALIGSGCIASSEMVMVKNVLERIWEEAVSG